MTKNRILCVMEPELQKNSVLMEVTMIVTQAQEELQNQLNKEVQSSQMSEGVVRHAVGERNL